jgi:hypothetical protein
VTRGQQRAKQRKTATTRLTLKVLRQLGVALTQLRCLLGDHLELVRDLREQAAGRRQVRPGRTQVPLQLRHPRLERRLLTSSGLGSIPGGGFSGSGGGLGPLGGLLGRRRGRTELLDLGSTESRSVATTAMAAGRW